MVRSSLCAGLLCLKGAKKGKYLQTHPLRPSLQEEPAVRPSCSPYPRLPGIKNSPPKIKVSSMYLLTEMPHGGFGPIKVSFSLQDSKQMKRTWGGGGA